MKFERTTIKKNTLDDTGTVRVIIVLIGKTTSAHKKGNIVRSLSIRNTKVSLVAAVVEKALFGKTS